MSAGGGDKKTGLSTVDKPDIEPINTQKERHGVSLSTVDKDRNHNTRDEIGTK